MIPQMDILGCTFNIWLFLKIHVYIMMSVSVCMMILGSIAGIMGGRVSFRKEIEPSGPGAFLMGLIELVIIIYCFIV